MLATTHSIAVLGLQTHPLEVEAVITPGIPRFDIVGLPDTAVSESRDRVRCALRSSRLDYPEGRITVNLAPADLKKEGPSFDLPIALAIAAASGQIPQKAVSAVTALGELALDGRVRGVPGVLPAGLAHARDREGRAFFLPAVNGAEARHVEGVHLVPVSTLTEAVRVLRGEQPAVSLTAPVDVAPDDDIEPAHDLSDVRGQILACRALQVMAAGGHNALLVGPPGAGKSMLAGCLPGILPRLSRAEALDVTQVYSVAHALPSDAGLIWRPPFRAPHHSCSPAGLIGGGSHPRPGEISLAHCGVLFLDEALEFPRSVLETLRQPLENGRITLSRAQLSITYPARIMLLLALNPCLCGHLGDAERTCTCSPLAVARYRARLSGPLLDRIDMHVEVSRRTLSDRAALEAGPPTNAVRASVAAAQERQRARGGGELNARMSAREAMRSCALSRAATHLLSATAERLGWSQRTWTRVSRLARTIADLDGRAHIADEHLEEAIALRRAGFTEGPIRGA